MCSVRRGTCIFRFRTNQTLFSVPYQIFSSGFAQRLQQHIGPHALHPQLSLFPGAALTALLALDIRDVGLLHLSGGQDSAAKRQALLKKLDLPEHLTANGLLEALNLLYSPEELSELVKKDLY